MNEEIQYSNLVDAAGLEFFFDCIYQKYLRWIGTCVQLVSGKGLSSNDYTTSEKNKLAGIATGAQVNVIESISVNNTALTVTDKGVNITVPTNYLTSSDINDMATQTWVGQQGFQTSNDVTSAVNSAISNLVGNAPTALDTLVELSAALGDDANFASTVTTALAGKADANSLATVATSGSYADLTNKPTFTTASGSNINSVGTPTVTVSTSNGTTTFTFDYLKGATGASGSNGQDGVTPHIDPTTGNWFIGTTNTGVHAQGAAGQNGTDGTNGTNGSNGKNLEFNWSGTSLGVRQEGLTDYSYVDLKGAAGSNGTDGTNGTNGTNGVSCTHSWSGTTLTVTSASGTSSADLKGAKGDDGLTTAISVNGNTYTQSSGTITLPNYPTVPTAVSSFTNDAGYLTSHQSISGKQDKIALSNSVSTSGSVTINADTMYNLGTISGNTTISLGTLPDSTYMHEYMFSFDTDSTVYTITMPSGVSFPSNVTIAANKHYEINIKGSYGLIASW